MFLLCGRTEAVMGVVSSERWSSPRGTRFPRALRACPLHFMLAYSAHSCEGQCPWCPEEGHQPEGLERSEASYRSKFTPATTVEAARGGFRAWPACRFRPVAPCSSGRGSALPHDPESAFVPLKAVDGSRSRGPRSSGPEDRGARKFRACGLFVAYTSARWGTKYCSAIEPPMISKSVLDS